MELTIPTLDNFLKDSAARNSRMVVRDHEDRVVMADERAIDVSKFSQNGVPLALIDLGRRVLVYDAQMSREIGSYVLSARLTQLSKESPKAVAGLQTPLGSVISDHGLYLKLKPGIEEIGVNDRNDLIVRYDESKPAPTQGPVINSANTVIAGRAERLVTRLRREEQEADRSIVNGAPGLELTQDVNWFLSEHPNYFVEKPTMTVEEFKSLMHERYGVTYGSRGEWTHIER